MRKSRAKSSELAHSYAVRLMQHLVVPTFVIDPNRRVVIWNRACERLTGVSAAEVLGASRDWRAVDGEQRDCLADHEALEGLALLLVECPPDRVGAEHGMGFSA